MVGWWCVGISILFGLFNTPATSQAATRCFAETGQCIDGQIQTFWQNQGAISLFGFPIAASTTTTVGGHTVVAQLFERQRIEYHANNLAPYDMLLGRVGADTLTAQGRDWRTFPQSGIVPNCRYFAATNQSVCGAILQRWLSTGIEFDGKPGFSDAERLALNGIPLSGLVSETLSDGLSYQVQWFERTRIELHPENRPPYNVLNGLLGSASIVANQSASPINTPSQAIATATVAPVFVPNPTNSNIPVSAIKAQVLRVVDGDTIHVSLNNKDITIRMIGIDTPETVDPRKPVQCFGKEASNHAHQLLDGATVYLEQDTSLGDYDKYNRLLRYIWMSDGRLFNQVMISEGYAFEYTYNLPYNYQTQFKSAQRNAQDQQLGLWSPNTCNGFHGAIAATATTIPIISGGGSSNGGGSTTINADSAPCLVGQIKGNRKSMIYHVPDGAFYAKTHVTVECFDSESAAIAAGYRRSKR
jgi:endonuclease YncB( thermonuclease family)